MHLDQELCPFSPAFLVLADGNVFPGVSIGAKSEAIGEVVFNTAMTGYQEILTDPSYAEQIVTLTYPHIGNVGVNSDDMESNKIQVAALIIRDYSPIVSNWRSQQSLAEYLIENNIVAIAGVDTRRLTRYLRDNGVQSGCIITNSDNTKHAVSQAKQYPGLTGVDLASEVTVERQIVWQNSSYQFEAEPPKEKVTQFHLVVYDFGVKYQMLRMFVDRGCQVTVVPAKTKVKEVMALNPDGVLLSNGPGDPAACAYAINNIKSLMTMHVPIFGICLGFQLLALACGASTFKMKFGHHGANHAVKDLTTGSVYITSQNHGFAVDKESLPDVLRVTHISLFDNTLQGFLHKTKPILAFQGHPEASPGPQDVSCLFDQFIEMMRDARSTNFGISNNAKAY